MFPSHTAGQIYEQAKQMALNSYLRRGFVPPRLSEIIKLAGLLNALQKDAEERPRVPAGSPDGGEWEPGGGDKHPGGSNKMNINKAVKHLNANAKKTPGGQCAKYVRKAIQAGDVNLKPPYPGSAKDYGPYLENYGFSPVSPTPAPDYAPEKGDIAVIQPINTAHPDGHIEMYNGSQWVSDYFQGGGDLWPGSHYRQATPSYKIYRQ